MQKDNKEEIFIKDLKELRKWLKDNYQLPKGVWITYSKGENRTMPHSNIVDELLCFGWIDSTAGSVNEHTAKLYISPRNPVSKWSKINKDKIEVLIKEKRMHENGLRLVKLGKQNGSWDYLNDVENLVVPKDLLEELEKYKNAKVNFENFSKSSRKMMLTWILDAKRPETRIKRIEEIAKASDKGIKIV